MGDQLDRLRPGAYRYESSEVVENQLGRRNVPSKVSVLVLPRQVGSPRERLAEYPAEPVVDPTLPQQPDGADQFTAQQHPVRSD
jgi:hypothetical protein